MWTVIQTWAIRASTVAAFVVISRQLEPSEFGLVALSIAVVSVLQLIAESGMGTYLVRKNTVSSSDESTVFWTGLTLTAVLSVGLAACSSLIAGAFDEPDLTPLLVALSFGLLVTGLSSVPTALLKRRLQFKVLAVRGTVATLTGTVVAIVLALAGAGAWALVVQFLVRSVLATTILWFATDWRPSLTWDGHQVKAVFRFSAKVLGLDLMLQARDRGEDFVLAGVANATTLGLWSVASRLVRVVQETGTSVVSTVATPTFAKLQEDLPRMYRAYSTSLAVSGAVMFPTLLFLTATSPVLIPFVLGEQWASTGTVAQVVAFTTALGVITYFDRTVFVAVDRLRPELILVAVIVITHLAVVIAFAPHGLLPLALALLVRAAVTVPVRAVVLHRVTGMPYGVYKDVGRVALAAVFMAVMVVASLYATRDASDIVRLGIAIAVTCTAYPLGMWFLARSILRAVLRDIRSLRRSTTPTPDDRRDAEELTGV